MLQNVALVLVQKNESPKFLLIKLEIEVMNLPDLQYLPITILKAGYSVWLRYISHALRLP